MTDPRSDTSPRVLPGHATDGHVVVFAQGRNHSEQLTALRDLAGITDVAASREFRAPGADHRDLVAAPNATFDLLGIAVVRTDPERLARLRTAIGPSSGIVAVATEWSRPASARHRDLVPIAYDARGPRPMGLLGSAHTFPDPDPTEDVHVHERSFVPGSGGPALPDAPHRVATRDTHSGTVGAREVRLATVLDGHGVARDRAVLAAIEWALDRRCGGLAFGFTTPSAPTSLLYATIAARVRAEGATIVPGPSRSPASSPLDRRGAYHDASALSPVRGVRHRR